MSVGIAEWAAQEMLTGSRTLSLWIRGGSMHPALRDGDRITVEPLTERIARRGEILLYDAPSGLTAHRLVGACAGGFLLRGDASTTLETVLPSQIRGRVISADRNGASIQVAGWFARAVGLARNHLYQAKRFVLRMAFRRAIRL